MTEKASARGANRYAAILERVFLGHYRRGVESIVFEREELEAAARDLDIRSPKNLGDLVYTFRYRVPLPEKIQRTATHGRTWVIRPAGRSQYEFVQIAPIDTTPKRGLDVVKVPDATPGVIEMYALGDEQSLLAKLRYNRLIDIFTGVACYSLQSHLRTTVPGMGQVETDEVYIGVDRHGAHYVFTVQAKGARESLGQVQLEQDLALCRSKFPALIPRPIGARFMDRNQIALFQFAERAGGLALIAEAHYRLVPSDQLSAQELEAYRLAAR
jgi:hypothetical protein